MLSYGFFSSPDFSSFSLSVLTQKVEVDFPAPKGVLLVRELAR